MQALHFFIAVLFSVAALCVNAQPALLLVAAPESEAHQVGSSPDLVVARYADKSANAISVADVFCGLHLMIDGEPWNPSSPAGHALMGGRPIGAKTRRSGPILLLAPQKVAETAQSLSAISKQDLRKRYDPDLINRFCMPTKASMVSDAQGLADFLDYFEPLRGFYKAAAQRGDAVLLLLWFGAVPKR